MNDIYAKIQFIVGIGIIFHVLLEMIIADKGVDPDIIIPGIDGDVIVVFAIDQGSIGEQAAIEDMVPPESGGGVPIVQAKRIAEPKVVLSKISRQVDMVLLP